MSQEQNLQPLLGATTIQRMALITVNNKQFRMVAGILQLDKLSLQNPDKIPNQFMKVCED